MRILLLDQFSEPGGAQQCLLDLLPAMRDRGWEVLVGLPGEGSLFESIRQLGVSTEQVACNSVLDVPVLAGQIRRMAQGTGAELLYLNGPRLLPGALAAGLGLPVVFHSHSLLQRGRLVSGLSLAAQDAIVIASCRYVARQWRGFVRRVSVVYNGVEGPVGLRYRAERPPTIGCIGRISPEKGQLEFLRVAALIHRVRTDCRFAVYGAALFGDPAYEKRVHAESAGLPVRFYGWVTDVYEALAQLDLLLVPSTGHEATTRVILEAYAAGVPVIAFPTGGIPEIIDSGRTGLLTGSVEAMAEAALVLLSEGCAEMREAARRRWERRHSVGRYRCEVLEVLERSF